MQTQYPSNRWEQALAIWLGIGLVWFLAGIAWIPTTKLYRQGLVLFLWLPAIICLFSQREILRPIFSRTKHNLIPILLFLLWAAISVSWSPADDYGSAIRRILYIFLFLWGVFFLSYAPKRWGLIKLMTASAYGLGLAAFLSILYHYGIEGQAPSTRLSGIGNLEHPILGGYVIGLMLLWLSETLPERCAGKAVAFVAISVMFLFVLLTQSRGLWVALVGTAIIYSILRGDRYQWGIAAGLLIFGALGYWLFDAYVTARGTSFRPEIFVASVDMILANPWLGLGLGADYDITVGPYVFSHSHNLFTHVAIELGLPGLMLWLAVWLGSFKTAWHYRETAAGSAVVKIFIFCSIAMLFDGGSLFKTPRPEWFFSWFPIALAAGLGIANSVEKQLPGKYRKDNQTNLVVT